MGNQAGKDNQAAMEAGNYKGNKLFLRGPVGDEFVPGNPDFVRFVFISDTHSMHENIKLPKGDVLIHTGDFTFQGGLKEIQSFSEWLGKQDFKHKIVVSGNHELTFDLENEKMTRALFGIRYS